MGLRFMLGRGDARIPPTPTGPMEAPMDDMESAPIESGVNGN